MSSHPPTQARKIGPQAGPQTDFLSSSADIVVYGGAAGGGKTYGLLLESLRHTGNPGFGAVIFRRTNKDIRNEGGLWDNSRDVYPLAGGVPREQNLDWTFPSGAKVSFSGLQYESDVLDWQGAQIALIGFDELTHFTERQFFYLLSRNRSMCGVRPYVRATCNPDPDSWIFDLLGPWVNPENPKYGAEAGEVRWLLRKDDEITWVPEGTPFAKSITFIPAKLSDNAILRESDPGYEANLRAQSDEDQDRLLHGLWTRRKVKGALWQQEWIDRDRVSWADCPTFARIVVAIDPAVNSSDESDETGIVVAAKGIDGHFYTLADSSGHYTPNGWAQEAIRLYDLYGAARIVAEKNQGGEMVSNTIQTVRKVPVELIHAKENKEVRADPVARIAEAGKDHHVGTFRALEAQLTRWVPGTKAKSPDRLDAKVYAILDLDPTLAAKTSRQYRSQYS